MKMIKDDFEVKQKLTLGKSEKLDFRGSIKWEFFRARLLDFNVPCQGFVIIDHLLLANINLTVGSMDAFLLNRNNVEGNFVDIPTMHRYLYVRFIGRYTGLVPRMYENGGNFELIMRFRGMRSEA